MEAPDVDGNQYHTVGLGKLILRPTTATFDDPNFRYRTDSGAITQWPIKDDASAYRVFEPSAYARLRELGFRVVDDQGQTDLLLGGVIVSFDLGRRSNGHSEKAVCVVDVAWQVYRPRTGEIVYTATTSGTAGPGLAYSSHIPRAALGALENLYTDPNFLSVLKLPAATAGGL